MLAGTGGGAMGPISGQTSTSTRIDVLRACIRAGAVPGADPTCPEMTPEEAAESWSIWFGPYCTLETMRAYVQALLDLVRSRGSVPGAGTDAGAGDGDDDDELLVAADAAHDVFEKRPSRNSGGKKANGRNTSKCDNKNARPWVAQQITACASINRSRQVTLSTRAGDGVAEFAAFMASWDQPLTAGEMKLITPGKDGNIMVDTSIPESQATLTALNKRIALAYGNQQVYTQSMRKTKTTTAKHVPCAGHVAGYPASQVQSICEQILQMLDAEIIPLSTLMTEQKLRDMLSPADREKVTAFKRLQTFATEWMFATCKKSFEDATCELKRFRTMRWRQDIRQACLAHVADRAARDARAREPARREMIIGLVALARLHPLFTQQLKPKQEGLEQQNALQQLLAGLSENDIRGAVELYVDYLVMLADNSDLTLETRMTALERLAKSPSEKCVLKNVLGALPLDALREDVERCRVEQYPEIVVTIDELRDGLAKVVNTTVRPIQRFENELRMILRQDTILANELFGENLLFREIVALLKAMDAEVTPLKALDQLKGLVEFCTLPSAEPSVALPAASLLNIQLPPSTRLSSLVTAQFGTQHVDLCSLKVDDILDSPQWMEAGATRKQIEQALERLRTRYIDSFDRATSLKEIRETCMYDPLFDYLCAKYNLARRQQLVDLSNVVDSIEPRDTITGVFENEVPDCGPFRGCKMMKNIVKLALSFRGKRGYKKFAFLPPLEGAPEVAGPAVTLMARLDAVIECVTREPNNAEFNVKVRAALANPDSTLPCTDPLDVLAREFVQVLTEIVIKIHEDEVTTGVIPIQFNAEWTSRLPRSVYTAEHRATLLVLLDRVCAFTRIPATLRDDASTEDVVTAILAQIEAVKIPSEMNAITQSNKLVMKKPRNGDWTGMQTFLGKLIAYAPELLGESDRTEFDNCVSLVNAAIAGKNIGDLKTSCSELHAYLSGLMSTPLYALIETVMPVMRPNAPTLPTPGNVKSLVDLLRNQMDKLSYALDPHLSSAGAGTGAGASTGAPNPWADLARLSALREWTDKPATSPVSVECEITPTTTPADAEMLNWETVSWPADDEPEVAPVPQSRVATPPTVRTHRRALDRVFRKCVKFTTVTPAGLHRQACVLVYGSSLGSA